jgi:exosortase
MSLQTRIIWFAAYLATACALFADLLRALYEVSRANEAASHLVLIPFVSIALVYQNRSRVFANLSNAWRGGLAVLAAAALLVGMPDAGLAAIGLEPSLSLRIAGLVGIWIAGFLMFFGPQAAREAVFPLGFLFLTIPLPAAVLAAATEALKVGSTEAVAALFSLTGTPYYRSGFEFTLATLAIEVADACSGIRSSIALAITALLIGHWSLRSPWAKVILVVAVLPLTILKNAIRIVSLSLLAVHVSPDFMVGRLHNDGGIVFFLLALALLSLVVAVLKRLEAPRRAAGPLMQRPASAAPDAGH